VGFPTHIMKEEEEEAASASIMGNSYIWGVWYVVPFDIVRFRVAASDTRS